MRMRTSLLLFNPIISTCIIICGCVSPPEQPRVEHAPPAEAIQPQTSPTDKPNDETVAKLPPPSATDVRNAISRMYKNAVLVDSSRYFVGDFNGDGQQDVAVVVRPAEGMLSEINSDVANWILEDARRVVLPDPTRRTQVLDHAEPTRVEQSDTLLAVLHGYGPDGWRDPRARQTYLLRNAVGTNMKAQRSSDFLQTAHGKAALPKLRGDVINGAIAGEQGFLYYTGAKYAWYRTRTSERTVASRR